MIDINTGLNLLGTGAGISILFFYIKSIKSDVRDMNSDIKDTNKDVKELKNGCFARHMKIERELGIREAESRNLAEYDRGLNT